MFIKYYNEYIILACLVECLTDILVISEGTQ